MRFLIDVCVARCVANFLRTAGHEVFLVEDVERGLPDEEILEWANRDNCVLVSNDKDFGRHIFQGGISHRGVFRLPNAAPPILVSLVRQVLASYEEDLTRGAVVTASTRHIRIRRS